MRMMRSIAVLALAAPLLGCPPRPPPNTIWKLQGAQTTILMSTYYGAAIYSLKWNGFEFVNSDDLGREIQTSYQLDGQGENNNPTEAGGEFQIPDKGETKTVIVGAGNSSPTVFNSQVHPAFWRAVNGQPTSQDLINKTVTLDWGGITNAVRHDVAVTLAAGHSTCVMAGLNEFVVGALTKVYTLNPDGTLTALPVPSPSPPEGTPSPGNLPLIMATSDGAYAIGTFSNAGNYLAWINIHNVNLGMLMANEHHVTPCPAGAYHWTVFYVVGNLSDVTLKLRQIKNLNQ